MTYSVHLLFDFNQNTDTVYQYKGKNPEWSLKSTDLYNVYVQVNLRLAAGLKLSGYKKLGWGYGSSNFGIGWHNAPGLSCQLGADILVCLPRSHVIYV